MGRLATNKNSAVTESPPAGSSQCGPRTEPPSGVAAAAAQFKRPETFAESKFGAVKCMLENICKIGAHFQQVRAVNATEDLQ